MSKVRVKKKERSSGKRLGWDNPSTGLRASSKEKDRRPSWENPSTGSGSSRKKKDKRPSWDEYFMDIAYLVARRSTCLRRQVGSVVVKNRRILSTGYNGTPSKITHCSERGCLRIKLNVPSGQRHEICNGLHAEQNALLQAALYGISLEGASLYITNQPCLICAKMIINSGLKQIVIADGYPDEMAKDFLKEAGINIRSI